MGKHTDYSGKDPDSIAGATIWYGLIFLVVIVLMIISCL